MLFPVFSIGVSAAEVETEDYLVYIQSKYWNAWLTYNNDVVIYPYNGSNESISVQLPNAIPEGLTATCYDTYSVQNTKGTPLVKKGSKTRLAIHNLYHSVLIYNTSFSTPYIYDNLIENVRALIIYTDSTSEYISVTQETGHLNGLHNFIVEFTPRADVQKVEFQATNVVTLDKTYSTPTQTTLNIGEIQDPEWALTIEQSSEEAGLLSSIIDWLKGIKTGITDLFDSITELPNKLWGLIKSGLQSLFVPSQDSIVTFKDNMSNLLSDRLGAVYEVVEISLESWEDIRTYDNINSIEIPKVSIDLPEGNKFEFGGYDVPIVPQGFEFLADMVKLAVGIVCSIMFVNGLRKRYDEVFGG